MQNHLFTPLQPAPAAKSMLYGCYRYGFNGQEKDDEITGVAGSHISTVFWEYDTRLGRRWNIDPKGISSESPYLCYAANPISMVDNDGDSTVYFMDGEVIAVSHDRLSNGIVHLSFDNDVKKDAFLAKLEFHNKNGSIDSKAANRELRKSGTMYSVKTLDYLQQTTVNANKGEAGRNLYLNERDGQQIVTGGLITFSNNNSRMVKSDFLADEPWLGTKVSDAHSHGSANTDPYMVYNPSDLDLNRAKSKEHYSIATDDIYFHFYKEDNNGREEIISFSREFLFDKSTIGKMKELRKKLGEQSSDGVKNKSAKENLGL